VPDEKQGRMNLEIPVQVLRDYILPNRALGPTRILDLSPRQGDVKPGHTVFGFVTVQCSNCEAPRHFWLLLKIGESGWLSEIPRTSEKEILPAFGRVLLAGDAAVSASDEVVPVGAREVVP
jgi:hypothetical protein